ncbi:MAG: hypothetical protein JW863_11760 [Chitinispirillaceae bacterium]|nr:hypothetical protein [Chitinispirillaceae bacterium]
MRTFLFKITLNLILLSIPVTAIQPNPLISKFQPIYASFTGSPTNLVNGKFGETAWTVTDSSWIAIKLRPDISDIFFTWNSTNNMWSDSLGNPRDCAEGLPVPVNYLLQVSENSTNGVDGTWKTVDSVVDNIVAARGHRIAFSGNTWIKMSVIKGGGKIDEVEVFDMSNGADDTWFFLGTSVTVNTFKKPVQMKTFREYIIEYVNEFNPKALPAFIRGGIGCATSKGFAAEINTILSSAGNVAYCAIEVGTYDAWGGGNDNVADFTNNLKKIITACKSKKIEPIIARTPATNPEKTSWQINEGYLAAIDELTRKYNLVPGPDLFSWFLQHPDELADDGVLPSPRGGANIQRLWAEAVYKLYDPNAPKRQRTATASKKKSIAKKKKR